MKGLSPLLYGMLGLILAGIISVSVILAPVTAGIAYWLSVTWVLILITLNWFTSVVVFGAQRSKREAQSGSIYGTLPAISLLIFFYSILSTTVLVFYNLEITGSKFHAVAQISLLLIFASVVLLAMTTPRLASSGMTSTVNQRDLLSIINRWRLMCADNADTVNEIDRLVNYIQFKMPHPARLDQSALTSLFAKMESIDAPETSDVRQFAVEVRGVPSR